MKASEAIVEIPLSVWESAETKEDLEDWLLANDPRFLAEMRDLRRQDLEGEFIPFRPGPTS